MSKQHLLFSIPRTCWTWLQHWIGPVLQLPPSRGTAVAKEIAGRARAKAVKKCIVWKAVGSSLFFLPRLTLDFILKSTCRFWDGTILWASENGNERSCHFDIPVSRLFRNTSDAALWQHIVFICAGWSQDLNCLLHLHRVLRSNSTGRENSWHTETISTAPVLFCETLHPWICSHGVEIHFLLVRTYHLSVCPKQLPWSTPCTGSFYNQWR